MILLVKSTLFDLAGLYDPSGSSGRHLESVENSRELAAFARRSPQFFERSRKIILGRFWQNSYIWLSCLLEYAKISGVDKSRKSSPSRRNTT